MKKTSLVVLTVTVLVVLAAMSVYAQTFTIRASVPFDFLVGSKVMPAGDYTFDTLLGRGIGRLSNADLQLSVAVLFQPTMLQAGSDKGSASLIFHRYDTTYFLSEVRNGFVSAGCLMPATNEELTLVRSASLHAPGEVVAVLAKR